MQTLKKQQQSKWCLSKKPLGNVDVVVLSVYNSFDQWWANNVSTSNDSISIFSGKCPPDGNPCTQICFNIHNNMYECGCKNGFVLSSDGYNCIIQGKLQQMKNRYVTRINILTFFRWY